MKAAFSVLTMILGLTLWLAVGCGETTVATAANKQVSVESESCELCLTPSSRASFLQASVKDGQFVANIKSLSEEEISEALAEETIGQDWAIEEVRVFNETRVPDMPRVRTAAEWRAKADQMRRDVLDKVVFRGGAAKWRNTKLKVEWMKLELIQIQEK